ncbi:MAG: hypothetical protein K8F36_14910 [Melioribacteraceae bacterium]|jgi:hypothetical protein|nr:hypothetical protein [Melioribacteraceae bacterium]MCO6474102.1 hypothetical protein [Melioribacteraceae bacterium]MDD3557580.1 hypothetical protein [Melioribacteraceae bacterium]
MGSLNNKLDQLLNDLKNLPRIQAPDNFEFNLNTKIQNGSFELKGESTPKKTFFWVTVPAFSLVLSAVILFFVVDLNPVEKEDLLMSRPEPIISATNPGSNLESISNQQNEVLELAQIDLPSNSPGFRMVLKQNDVVVKERINYPFDLTQSVDLDKQFGASGEETEPNSSPIRTVGSGTSNAGFGGFLVRVPMTLDERKTLKAKLDSIKQLQGEINP